MRLYLYIYIRIRICIVSGQAYRVKILSFYNRRHSLMLCSEYYKLCIQQFYNTNYITDIESHKNHTKPIYIKKFIRTNTIQYILIHTYKKFHIILKLVHYFL